MANAIKWTDPGEMRKRITIQNPDVTPTAAGGTDGEEEGTLATVCMAWAKIAPLTGSEAWRAKEQQSMTTHKINLLYQPGITSRMQALYQGRVFNFTDVRDLGEWHRELEITATEVIAT